MDIRKIRSSAIKIRDVYNACFNYGWFHTIIDEMPINPYIMRDFREFLASSPWETPDIDEVHIGSMALDALVAAMKNHMLPHLKELLRVSNLAPGLRISDRDQYVKMRLLIEVIPANIETLELYGEELRRALNDDYIPANYEEILPMGQKFPAFVGE